VAIIDDITLAGPVDQIAEAFKRAVTLLPDLGLQLSTQKTSLLWPSPSIPPPLSLSSLAANSDITLVQGAVPLLGSIVGLDKHAIRTFLRTKVDHHQEFFEALRCPRLPAQHALLLLRLSAHPRMNFLLRTLPPDLTAAACAAFDTQIRTSAIHILQLTHDHLSQVALDQFRLPLRRGGLGLPSMLSIAPAAFWAL
jgi:hypothetical protein